MIRRNKASGGAAADKAQPAADGEKQVQASLTASSVVAIPADLLQQPSLIAELMHLNEHAPAGDAPQHKAPDGHGFPSAAQGHAPAHPSRLAATATASVDGAPEQGRTVLLSTTPVTTPSPAVANGSSASPGIVTPPISPSVLCCGVCGYYQCPAQILGQGTSTVAGPQLTGQLVQTGPDFVVGATPATFGASVSDSLSTANVTTIANWRDTLTTTGPIVKLPGGGEISNATLTGQSGVLGGAVTQAAATGGTTQAAATSTNPIVLENQKQGNPESEWGIDGAGDSNIEGFATDISVNHGSTINFKINTNSNHYRIDIYRLGYYGGDGARKVATIDHTGVQNQPNPLVDPTTGLVDAGNWSVSASWAVPADAVSGVYIAKLTRLDGTAGENQIPFIVRDDSGHSDVLFQTSDETWQAYNGWGGANFYGGNGPAPPQGAGRGYAVSYNRPIATRGGVGTAAGPQDYLFGAEYSAISWLEQNGYDVSYMAGVDVDRFGSLLQNHKVYVDAGHDEYWSGQQRTNVEAARDAGVNLEFWSGNEVYWETRFANAISSDATPYRTLVSYKETWANADSDPNSQWTGTFRDPRFAGPNATGAGNPENSLTGQLFQVDDTRFTIGLKSITVPYADANLRFWRNTSVANLQPGQTATLTQNYLGYEWDEAVDNGFDPAGLVKLSSTTMPVNTYLLDYGNTTGNATATHSLTLYRAPSGALVFGAGTVYWPWALSDNHDLEATPTDPRIQQAMVNLFADMGIQPGTLQSGLITGQASTDHTAPASTINTLGTINAGQTVTITGTASDVGGVVAGVEISTDNGSTWHPVTGKNSWSYIWTPQVAGPVTIKTRAVDDSINLETPSAGKSITIGAPAYVSLFAGDAAPAMVNVADAAAVELGVKFSSSVAGQVTGVRFYKSSQDIGTHTGELWSSTGQKLATVTFANESVSGWQTAYFSTPVGITAGATYTVSFHTNSGHYAVTDNYFASSLKNGPLTAGVGAGVYAYGANPTMPTGVYQNENFWVDPLFVPVGGAANNPPVAVNDSGITAIQNTQLPIAAPTLLGNDSDPDGDALAITAVGGATHGTVTLNTQSNPNNTTVTFTPDAGYTGAAGFTYTISDGRGGTATASVSLNVVPPGSGPVSLFTAANVPTQTNLNDNAQLELGVMFQSSVAGQVSAIKFYRASSDTGNDVVDLWSATGTLLGTGTFTNTSATGWQQVNLTSPVTLTANTTYVASYHSTGGYAATNNYFTSAVTSGVLSAPAAGNGVYTYGGSATTGIFPQNTYGGSNYYVDVVFTPSGSGSGGNTAPTAVADTASATEAGGVANGTAGSPGTGNVLTNDTDPDAGDTKTVTAVAFGATAGTLGTALAGAYGSLVLNANGSYTYTVNDANATVQALRTSANTLTETFTYTMKDTAGATSSTTLTVTIKGANDAPTLATQTPTQNATANAAFTYTLPSTTFADVDAGDTITYSATLQGGGSLPSWLSFNASTRTFSGTPPSAQTVLVQVTGTDAAGLSAVDNFSIVAAAGSNHPPTAVADTANATEKGGVANGTAGSNGTGNVLTNDTDVDTGDTKTVTAVSFGATAGTLGTALAGAYGSLVLAANGTYTYTINETNAAVQALRQSTDTLTDTFNYTMKDTAGATSSTTLTVTVHGANDAPTLATQTGAQSATAGTAYSFTLPANTFADVDAGDTLTYTAALQGGGSLPSWLTFNPTTKTFSGTPTSTDLGTVALRVTATDAGGLAAVDNFGLTVSSATSQTYSLFNSSATPVLNGLKDGTQQLEVGVKFQSSVAGQITALKFYRSSADTGQDVLDLWSSTGTNLATVTFNNTTAQGWQTVNLTTPVSIAANTTYVASYHTTGGYVATSGALNSAITSGPLTALATGAAGGNGVYAYGGSATTGLFPTNSYNAANYFADVVFRTA